MAPRSPTPPSTYCRRLQKPSSRVLINSISHSCASDKHKHGIQLKRHGSLKALIRRYPHFGIRCERRRFCWLAAVTFPPKVPSSVYISAGCQLNLTNRVKQTAQKQHKINGRRLDPSAAASPQRFRDDGCNVSSGFPPSPSFHEPSSTLGGANHPSSCVP